ncbi:MAG TPA: hypothetical protein VFU26_08870 [Gaiellaceae bacterium]|nr:hypothetical protein [Gaiellaceae bacterium]
MPVVGSRFLIEAGFIIAAAVVAGIERLSTWWIIAVVASAWLIVAAVEIVVWARQVVARQPLAQAPERPVQDGSRAPTLPPPVPEPRREPVAVSTPAPPPLVAVPPPPAQPEPEPVVEPEPVAETALVVPFPANDSPREWNLWELERAARDHASDDVARNEERAYLLMYLREFAGPDGMLPADFDGLVRDAFADLLHAVA